MKRVPLPIPHPEFLQTHSLKLNVLQKDRDRFRKKFERNGAKVLLVGIAWQGINGTTKEPYALNVLEWGPIFHVPGCAFVNVQHGEVHEQLAAVEKGFRISVADAEIDAPESNTNALASKIAALDLVIAPHSDTTDIALACGIPVLGFSQGGNAFPVSGNHLQQFFPDPTGDWLSALRDAGLSLLNYAFSAQVVDKKGPYLRSLAQAYASMNRFDDAEALYRALAAEPGLKPEGMHQIGALKAKQQLHDEALKFFDEALTANPSFWQSYNAKGMSFAALLRLHEAIAAYEKALEFNPESGEARNNLGTALRRIGRATDALKHYQKARDILPNVNSVHLNLAAALYEAGKPEEAIVEFTKLIAREPNHVDAHHHRAQINLALGRFDEGWPEFQWRLKRADANVRHDIFPHPIWRGEDLTGKNVLVWTEQGIGDEILTASMIPDAINAAKHVTVLCSERLVPLMRRSFPNATVDLRAEPLPKCATDSAIDFQMSLSELGGAFRKSFDDFPTRKQFLNADPDHANIIRGRYESLFPSTLRVGLSWMSQKNYEVGWLKSHDLTNWAPILKVPGIKFINLQYGDRANDLACAREQLNVDIFHDQEIDPLKDMDAFAAQVAALDLVISVSNTTVHTAGGLGVPVWTLVAKGRGRFWYWFRDRSDSPWYPSMRLFNQETSGDWAKTVKHCAAALEQWVREKSETS